jgi:hypothetical protein
LSANIRYVHACQETRRETGESSYDDSGFHEGFSVCMPR